jgi:hypothetical protein
LIAIGGARIAQCRKRHRFSTTVKPDAIDGLEILILTGQGRSEFTNICATDVPECRAFPDTISLRCKANILSSSSMGVVPKIRMVIRMLHLLSAFRRHDGRDVMAWSFRSAPCFRRQRRLRRAYDEIASRNGSGDGKTIR